ncbi:MAG: DegT/DnrJ/EryC1/StrS family aminotransferase, partial [Elusimicrobia bacterium]|nr:DegT/DnrJ/EryC1/StrS family aminotransferase [Elusimicrobiota bacterium]
TGDEEKASILRVLDRGVLSAFEGTNNEFFLGGPEVRDLEAEWASKSRVKHAVAVNSATSGLLTAVQAAGVGPGDEVVVTPFTMSGTVAAIIAANAVPVFADVELRTFNLDPQALERRITSRTKAVLAVDIFGHPADMDAIKAVAGRHNLIVIEDAAQAPGALYHGKAAGTLGDIGVFSLNCNKHIQCGEGGIVVTGDDRLAQRARLIRNHAEAVVASGMEVDSLAGLVGFNLRMTELEAAISRCQLRKLDDLLARRLELVRYLESRLKDIPGLRLPEVLPGCTHVYYRYALVLDRQIWKVPARVVVRALNAEGLEFYVSYMRPLYLQPIFQRLTAYGEKGCPFKCPHYQGQVDYAAGCCPNAEKLEDFVISTEIVRPPQTKADMDEIHDGLRKVLDNIQALRDVR